MIRRIICSVKNRLRSALDFLFYQLPLRFKMMLSFILVFCSVFILLVLVTTRFISNFVERQLLNSATEVFNQITTSVQNTFIMYEKLTLGAARSKTFDDLMSKDMTDASPDEILSARQDFETKLYAFLPDIVSPEPYHITMKIFFNDHFDYFNNPTTYFDLQENADEPWIRNIAEQYSIDRTGYYLIPGSVMALSEPDAADAVSIVRVVMDKAYYPHILALLRLDFPVRYLDEMITTATFSSTVTCIMNSENEIFACSDRSCSEELMLYAAQQDLSSLPEDEWIKTSFAGEQYVIRTGKLENYDLFQCSLIPVSSLYHDLYAMKKYLILSAVLFSAACFFLISYISGLLTSRILNVVNTLRQVKNGELEYIIEDHTSTDEVGELVNSYNYLVDQINMLMNREYEHGQEIKLAELKTLQAQINPHFLYNTLDMIYWMAVDGMDQEIQEAVNYLGTFYRIGLSNGQEMIPLRKELEHASSYISLWNLRRRGSINYSTQIPAELEDCLIIKTTIQPFLENAVSHGILEKEDQSGNIEVVVREEEGNSDYINILISDDGIGMSEAMIASLNRDPGVSSGEGHGFGIHSVQSRIRLFYGNDCGVTFMNRKPGTLATIRIPRIKG